MPSKFMSHIKSVRRAAILAAVSLALVLAGYLAVSAVGSFELPLSRQSLGGGTSSSANFELHGSAGGVIGESLSSNFKLRSGFWASVQEFRRVPIVLESGSGTVTPEDGGTVSTGISDVVETEAAVVVPAGAVDEDVVLQVDVISATDPNLPPLPANTLPQVFRFTPEGFVFNATVTLKITYLDSQIVGFPESILVPFLVVGDTVVQVAACLDADAPDPDPCFASLDTTNNIISINTTHFSTYGVEGTAAAVTAAPAPEATPEESDDDGDDDDDDTTPEGGSIGAGGAPPGLNVSPIETSFTRLFTGTTGTVGTGVGDSVEASVTITQGALFQDTVIQIDAISSEDPVLPPLPAGSLSRVFRFSPEGIQFLEPVTLTIAYENSETVGIDETTLSPILLVNGEWLELTKCVSEVPLAPDPCLETRDLVHNQISISTTQFSIYGLRGEGLNPPADVSTALEQLGDNLVRVFHFDNTTKEWTFYDPRPTFADSNTLEELVLGDAYFIKVKNDQVAVLNGKEHRLIAGWSLIGW